MRWLGDWLGGASPGQVQMVHMDMRLGEMIVRRDWMLDNPPGRRDQDGREAVGQRRGEGIHHPHRQASFLAYLPERNLAPRFVGRDMAARRHRPAEGRMLKEPDRPPGWPAGEYLDSRGRVLHTHRLIVPL